MSQARLTISLTDVWGAGLHFDDKRDAIVRLLADSEWEHDDLAWMLSALSQAEWFNEFDTVFSWIYDIADADNVRIRTRV